ncbi:FemAB family protein [uncultured archaeon]|nr:FemAB family protein [uncultured archaeon]
MTIYNIEELNHSNENDWEEFNKKTDGGSFFHTLKWKNIIENSFNSKLHYYLIYFDDKVIAICPFCENTIKGFRGLIPISPSDYRHLLIGKQDFNHLEEIIKKIIEISRKDKNSFVMITTINQEVKDYLKKNSSLPYPFFRGTGNFVLNLKENPPEKIWQENFKWKTRNSIRKFEKDGFTIREATSIDDLKFFYKYYKMNLEYRNRIPYHFSHFERLWDTYSLTEMRIILLCRDEKVHGGLLLFIYPPSRTVYLRHIAIDRNLGARYKLDVYLCWQSIRFASDINFDTVCFGETPNDPNETVYKYKKSFGCSYENIYSYVFPFSFAFRMGYNMYKYFNLPQQIKKIRDK